jgi:hypothetical protein
MLILFKLSSYSFRYCFYVLGIFKFIVLDIFIFMLFIY